MQQQLAQPFTEQDLEGLDHFLANEAQEDSMDLDELHDFLAAVICSPQMVLPSQWIPHVWGDQEPEFANMDQAQDITGMMMRLNNDVAARLSIGDFDPLFMEETLANGHVVLDPHGWCHGFVRGMQLQPDASSDDELNEALMPIIVLSDTIENDPKIDELLEDDEAVEKLAEAISGAVVTLYSAINGNTLLPILVDQHGLSGAQLPRLAGTIRALVAVARNTRSAVEQQRRCTDK